MNFHEVAWPGIANVLLAKLTISNVFLLTVGYAAYKVVTQIVYYRFFSPIKEFKGPFWGSFTRLWIAWHNFRATELTSFEKYHNRYGELVELHRLCPTQ